jgi:hypothetical protein
VARAAVVAAVVELATILASAVSVERAALGIASSRVNEECLSGHGLTHFW